MSADFILLDRNIFACPAAHEIGGTQGLLTPFRGRVVHRQAGFGG